MPRIVLSNSSDDDDDHQQKQQQQKKQQQQGGSFNKSAAPASAAAAAAAAPKKAPLATIRVVTNSEGTDVPVRNNTKVFIDGLPFNDPPGGETLQDQLSAFCTAWKVGKVTHLSKKPGQGFAYLAFRSPNSVDVAVAVLDGKKFLGRHLRVEVPKPPRSMRENAPDAEAQHQQQQQHKSASASSSSAGTAAAAAFSSSSAIKPQTWIGSKPASAQGMADSADYTRQVLLSDLPAHAQPDILREVLAEYCPALEKHVTKIKMTSRNRKAFVTLDSEPQAQELQGFLHGFTILGRKIEASMAQPPGAAPFAPMVLARQQQQKEFKAIENDKSLKVVPSGWGADASAAAAAAQDKNPVVSAREIVGSNARKEFPMPVLIHKNDSSNDAAASAGSRIRQRDAPSGSATKPQNSAAATASSRFDSRGPRTVYIANLPSDVTEKRLRQHLAGGTAGGAAPSAASASLIRSCKLQHVNGVSNGIAVIEYALPADAKTSAQRFNGSMLGGQRLEVELDGAADAAVHGAQGADESTIDELRRKARNAEPDEEDLDAFAKHYGVKDRKKFLAEADRQDDDDEDDEFDNALDDVLKEDVADALGEDGGGGKNKKKASANKNKKQQQAKKNKQEQKFETVPKAVPAAPASAASIAQAAADEELERANLRKKRALTNALDAGPEKKLGGPAMGGKKKGGKFGGKKKGAAAGKKRK